ncbi:PPK2 family polyphosphate:nucleotide phosphotransferase [Arthrobacter stackebrandtii]|uniref:PPK2 family polyphosphate:nucleotide phosphotransferase n=1 Tax=Arthrobacter stackebrandtii TaxID=272161 RepID=A0ABS4YXG0_9MICC|nr:polyphosphate kinase 2 family protein [Arthrobacter stackebrandtii]MBP2413482.1 PPK2 family polyphosphate:nucleotide phosphotransferase [Arthrobacter stackebrandtii]PYH00676.1 phosphate--nucleotide phosphotransferase [Arthrobacter stackebrandtii]
MSLPIGFTAHPSELLRVEPGFTLAGTPTDAAPGYSGKKDDGAATLAERAPVLAQLQEQLFAESRFEGKKSVLLILQAMDTAGKGGIVGRVVGAVDPQGVKMKSFKAPTEEEKAHDFLWRVRPAAPEPGMLGVFDRSHYEDVLIHRVHGWADEAELERRYAAINAFEQELVDAGTTIVKVMLNVGRDEQLERLGARLHDPTKYWKYNPGDLDERAHWPAYMDAYQRVFDKTSTDTAPWHVVPADKKWYARMAVQELLIKAMGELNLQWPAGDYDLAVERARLKDA